MGKVYKNLEELIGNTPMAEFSRLKEALGCHGQIFAKLEWFNPCGSAKDRIARQMIEEAEKAGLIKPAFSCIIEPTSGNTGIGLAAIGRQRGYRVVIVMPENMSEERKKIIELDLSSAVENDQLVIEIQPKYDLKTGKCVSAEALVRWEHPQLGRICPDEFIPISEKTGDVIDIDMFVLEAVCKHMRRWLDMGVNPVPIAVNQSSMHIADPNYVESVFKMMQKYDVWPSMIELETTESVIINDYKKVSRVLEHLRNYGFVLSMDDFGSGFTSIDMLSELEYDVLKLDQKLIAKIADYPRTYSLVKHLIAMAHEMNMIVVAEGVETAVQAELLKGIDCDQVQGFHYSRPVSVESFDANIFGIVTI